MKNFSSILLNSAIVTIAMLLFPAFSCGQNGPTQPSVKLNWTQSTTAGVTANCVYRGSASGVYNKPALFCSTAPITTYTDLTVSRGTTYHYAVTAQLGGVEGGYSNDVGPTVPTAPASPSMQPPTETRKVAPIKPGSVPMLTAQVSWN